MISLLTDLRLSRQQIIAATQAMLRIAHVDGARTAEEVALIRLFYAGCNESDAATAADWPAFDALVAGSPAARLAAAEFPDRDGREMVLATCIMVAYADGELSAPELAALHALAADLGIDAERFEHLLALVKDHMLAQLAGLPDAGSVAAVARELG